MQDAPVLGTIGWFDLTVEDAPAIRDFYAEVVGWKPSPVPMGEYDDFNMTGPTDDTPRAGVCHSRGGNEGLPPAWLAYIYIANLGESLAACEARGGKLVRGPLEMGADRYAVIQDPAGAYLALYQKGSGEG
ncbi:MAG: VOC family protein [Acidobacteriota bacterium]